MCPALGEKNIEVLLDDGVLTLKGEKRSETADRGKQVAVRLHGPSKGAGLILWPAPPSRSR